jgi:hypothetical protein
MYVSCECCVLSDRCLSDGLIHHPEESYQEGGGGRESVCMCGCAYTRVCVSLSVIRCNSNRLHLQRVGKEGRTVYKPIDLHMYI